ncbi:VOC family protein [Rhodococcus erythropolis]|uniref:VOC family protein n=1 Tax=Rhodococcus erythropolis TaxID=1833 RepID=UPI00197F3A4E|nr:VOC family protein [Rhodococcus erythropolis]QSE41313.1 VOC family protein [Rhodococcus erythropolis]
MITRVSSVTLEVPDLADSITFYEDHVGLTLTEELDGTAYLRARTAHHDMILQSSSSGRSSLVSFNFESDDVAADVARAVEAGSTDLGQVPHAGTDLAHLLAAPGGFGIRIHSALHRVEAAPDVEPARPQHFSHFNIGVPNAAEVIEFFVQLGLRNSDWIGSVDDPMIGWLHCPVDGALHHGVAVIHTDDVRLHHISFEYDNASEIVDRIDDYVDDTHYLVWGMGRHGTGGSIFAYIEDPSGTMVELGTGMIRIGRDPRWTEPRVWALDDPRGVDEWGSAVPEAWLAKRVDVAAPTTSTRA